MQQSLPKGAPDWVARCEVPRRKGGDITHGMINDADTLRWLAQQNCVTPHVWNARCDRRDRPDRLVFDLDPTGEDFDEIREGGARRRGAAALARPDAVREGLRLARDPRRSRRSSARAPVDEVRAAAQTLADQVAAEHPDTLTTAWRKDKRDGRILVDVARNTYGQTIVAPYAVRALPGAPISAPVSWDEVEDPGLGPQKFKLRDVRRPPERARRPVGGHRRARRGAAQGSRHWVGWGHGVPRQSEEDRRAGAGQVGRGSEPGFLLCARRRAGHGLRPARPADPVREDGIAAARRSDRGRRRACRPPTRSPPAPTEGQAQAAGHAGRAVSRRATARSATRRRSSPAVTHSPGDVPT